MMMRSVVVGLSLELLLAAPYSALAFVTSPLSSRSSKPFMKSISHSSNSRTKTNPVLWVTLLNDDDVVLADEDGEEDKATMTTTTTPEHADSSSSLPFLYPDFAPSLKRLGFITPTPIQAAVAEQKMDKLKKNLLLVAPTGSGKTLAYLLEALRSNNQGGGTILMVAPTRELAVQLLRDAAALTQNDKMNSIALAIRGLPYPTNRQYQECTFLIGTPDELFQAMIHNVQQQQQQEDSNAAHDFMLNLSCIILDEADVLLPPADPKLQRLIADTRKESDTKNKERTPQEERRRQEQFRKLRAAKRDGRITEGTDGESSSAKVMTSTDKLLSLIASTKSSSSNVLIGSSLSSSEQEQQVGVPQILGGSATASRKTLDRLNQSLRVAAKDAGFSFENIWGSNVQICRPTMEGEEEGTMTVSLDKNKDNDDVATDTVSSTDASSSSPLATEQQQQKHTIRAVTVPAQVQHKYITVSKADASCAEVVMSKVAYIAKEVIKIPKSKTALVFLCGEFKKQPQAMAKENKLLAQRKKQKLAGKTSKARRNAIYKEKKKRRELAKKLGYRDDSSKNGSGLSARQACFLLKKYGINEAKPLHVVLGLEGNKNDEEEDEDDVVPPFLVTFEGSARGLHLEDVDVVFVVGRPASAASYLHLAGRVGRASPTVKQQDGNNNNSIGVQVKPGTVVSICTKGSASELLKWTKQIGGTALQEIILGRP